MANHADLAEFTDERNWGGCEAKSDGGAGLCGGEPIVDGENLSPQQRLVDDEFQLIFLWLELRILVRIGSRDVKVNRRDCRN